MPPDSGYRKGIEVELRRGILKLLVSCQRDRDIEGRRPFNAMADLRAIARPKACTWRNFRKDTQVVADRQGIASNAAKTVRKGNPGRQQRISQPYHGGRIDRVRELGVHMLYCWPAAHGKPTRNPIGGVRIDVDGLYAGFDRLLATNPVAVVLEVEAKGSG
jgi:hypothetical protein